MRESTQLIYNRVQTTSPSDTVELIQSLLNERLNSEYRRIWVQTTRRGMLLFTIFSNSGYLTRTFNTGGLRQFRVSDNINQEIVIMERFLESLRNGVLYEFVY